MSDSQSSTFANNILWKMIDLISRKAFGFAISILLARLLMPDDYGVIALTIVFIAFTNIFILNGFNVALVRRKTINDIHYSTVMVMSIFFVGFINIIVFFTSSKIADFYGIKVLSPVLRAMVFGLFFSAISAVVSAKATRELKFKQMAIPSFCSNAIGGVVAVIMAYMGFGVWALVFQHLIASFVVMIWYILIFHFAISFKFSLSVIRELYKFTLGVVGTSFLDFLGNHFCSLVVGKVFDSKGLGHYDRAGTFPDMISSNFSGSISNVLLPTLSKCQDNIMEIKNRTRKTISFTLYIIFPVMFALIGSSNVLVPVLLTEKWNPIVPLLCVCCLLCAITPFRTIEYSVLYALGMSKYCVKAESLRTSLMIFGVIFVAIVLKASLIWVVFANLVICMIVTSFIHYHIKTLIDYSFSELFKDTLQSLIFSLLIMAILAIIGRLFASSLVLLIVQTIIGVIIYIALSIIFNNKNYIYIKNYLLFIAVKLIK